MKSSESRAQQLVRAAVGIIRRDGKVLVAQRPVGKPYSGYWEFPGGKIEENESGADALKRELQEELGITVIRADHWFEHIHEYPDKTVFLEMFMVTEFTGEPHGKENQELRWVTLDEILDMRLLEGNWPIIEKIKTLF